jgi:hypothetical protein
MIAKAHLDQGDIGGDGGVPIKLRPRILDYFHRIHRAA